MAPEVLLYGSSSELPNPQEFAKTELVDIRSLNPDVEGDMAIAQQWDREATGEEGALEKGAIHPFDTTSRNLMSEDELRRWMRGDERHLLRGIFAKEGNVGFVYAYDDADGRKRLRHLQSLGLVPKTAAHMEVNWWTDRASPEQAESGITQALLDLFIQRRADQVTKKTKHPLSILLYVEQDDLRVDGEMAKRLGFREIKRGFSYDTPGTSGTDTVFMFTEELLSQAINARITPKRPL